MAQRKQLDRLPLSLCFSLSRSLHCTGLPIKKPQASAYQYALHTFCKWLWKRVYDNVFCNLYIFRLPPTLFIQNWGGVTAQSLTFKTQHERATKLMNLWKTTTVHQKPNLLSWGPMGAQWGPTNGSRDSDKKLIIVRCEMSFCWLDFESAYFKRKNKNLWKTYHCSPKTRMAVTGPGGWLEPQTKGWRNTWH